MSKRPNKKTHKFFCFRFVILPSISICLIINIYPLEIKKKRCSVQNPRILSECVFKSFIALFGVSNCHNIIFDKAQLLVSYEVQLVVDDDHAKNESHRDGGLADDQ